MIFYCPNCWREIADDKEACSHCGENPSSWEAKKYSAKLIEALAHPEPDTRSRAVYLLGEKRTVEAVEPLFSLFRRSVNPFLQGEVIEALGKIGGLSTIPVLMDALRHPSFVVRGEAVKALAKFPRNGRIQAALKRSAKDPSAYVREIVKDALKIPEQTRKAV
jgi:HEAT repeat protein